MFFNDDHLIIPCLNSLIKSDISNYDFKLFIHDNGSHLSWDELYDIEEYQFPYYCKRTITNEGIVNPRIGLYNQIISEGFDLLLEIHCDMLFPEKWFEELVNILDDETVIAQPFIYQPPKDKLLNEFNCDNFKIFKQDKRIYEGCRQVHPWLINLNLLNNVGGYYDSNFSPYWYEDDDLVYRIYNNGFKIKTTNKSIVLHYGSATRAIGEKEFFKSHRIYWKDKHNAQYLPDQPEYYLKEFTFHPRIAKGDE